MEDGMKKLTVTFPGSDEKIASPYGDEVQAARHAMILASGRDPGTLYFRAGSNGVRVWTRKKIQTPSVTVTRVQD
jgi:hypothetical protein